MKLDVLKLLFLVLLLSSCGAGDASPGQAVPFGEVRPLPRLGDVSHAATSRATGHMLLISRETLFVFGPDGQGAGEIELSAAPCGLSVNGRRAVISHAGFLTLVDLGELAVEKILDGGVPCSEVALSEHAAYLIDTSNTWRPVVRVPLSGEEPENSTVELLGVSYPVLHSSGTKIYVAGNDRVGRVGLDEEGRVDEKMTFDTRLYGESGCRRLWLMDDGEWAYTACGGRLRTNDRIPERLRRDAAVTDLSPAGELPLRGVVSLCEHGGVLAAVPAQFHPYRIQGPLGWEKPDLLDEDGGRTIEFFSHPRLRSLKSVTLPAFPGGGAARGHAVFCGLELGQVQVLVKDEEAGLWGLVKISVPEEL